MRLDDDDASALNWRIVCEASCVWMLAASLVAVSAYAAGADPFVAQSYVRFDSGHYLAIAEHGYEFQTCPPETATEPARFCGNAGWMPGYPLLVRLLLALNTNPAAAGLLCSCVFFFGSLILLRVLLEAAAPGRDNLICFLATSVFPGGIYFFSVFPISMLLFLSLLTMLFLGRDSYFLGSISAAGGAFVYATGFLLTGVVVAAILANPRAGSWSWRLGKAFLFGTLALMGLCAVLAIHHIAIGHWNAFFLVQAKYGHGLHDPIGTLRAAWADLARQGGTEIKFVRELQTMIVAGVVISALTANALRFRQLAPVERMGAVHTGLFWLFPLIMGRGVSPTRSEALLLPMVVLFARSPQVVRVLMIVLFAFLAFEVNVAFFKSVLI